MVTACERFSERISNGCQEKKKRVKRKGRKVVDAGERKEEPPLRSLRAFLASFALNVFPYLPMIFALEQRKSEAAIKQPRSSLP